MRFIFTLAILAFLTEPAFSATTSKGPNLFQVSVWGKDNIFGAGKGGVKANGGGNDPVRLAIPAGAKTVEITQASGRVSCCSGGSTFNAANGGTFYKTNIGSSGGISGIIAPWNMFLIGVFIGNKVGPMPARLDVAAMRTKADVWPQLDQTFFVGDGRAGKVERRIHIPAGAKYLDLGFADSNSFNGPPGAYDDNVGSLDVRGAFLNGAASTATSAGYDLTGNWSYDSGRGAARVTQSGSRLSMRFFYPVTTPAYLVTAALLGNTLTGKWRCITTMCRFEHGAWRATVDSTGNTITVSGTEDPGGRNAWNRTVLTRVTR